MAVVTAKNRGSNAKAEPPGLSLLFGHGSKHSRAVKRQSFILDRSWGQQNVVAVEEELHPIAGEDAGEMMGHVGERLTECCR